MSQKILDYALDTLTPANPDSSLPATVTGCTVVAGPGVTSLGTFPKALDFSANGRLHVALPAASCGLLTAARAMSGLTVRSARANYSTVILAIETPYRRQGATPQGTPIPGAGWAGSS